MYEKGTFVGFQTSRGPTLGLVQGQIPCSQIHLVRVVESSGSMGIREVLFENLSVLGQAKKNEQDKKILERHCQQIVSFLADSLSKYWEIPR